jgi:hypothetical protein
VATISLRRLSDKTIAKYEQLEKDGTLTKRQRQLWDNHKVFVGGDGRPSFMDIFLEARKQRIAEENER